MIVIPTQGQNEEQLTADAGDVILMVMKYPSTDSYGESLVFTETPWTVHGVFPHLEFDYETDAGIAMAHVYVVSLRLPGPLPPGASFEVPLAPDGWALVPEGHPNALIDPAAEYVMYALGNVGDDVVAAAAHAYTPGPVEDPWVDPWDTSLPVLEAPAGGMGLLIGIIQDQVSMFGPPSPPMSHGPLAEWHSPPYSRRIIESFHEAGLPAGDYARDYEEMSGYSGDKVLLVLEPSGEPGPGPGPEPEPGEQAVFYAPDNLSFLSNPDVGWHSAVAHRGSFQSVRNSGQTITRWLVRLDAYRTTALDSAALNTLRLDLQAARDAGIKLMLRHVYNYDWTSPDASLSRILQHIEQLSPVWTDFQDVISSVQAGFIGAWGEWHSSTNGLTDADPAGRRAVLRHLLDYLPSHIPIHIRYPDSTIEFIGGVPLSREERFTDTDRARLGILNDSFLANFTDGGTFVMNRYTQDYRTNEATKAYWRASAPFTANTGETVDLDWRDGNREDGPSAMAEMESFAWDSLNREYSTRVINGWIASGHYDEITRHLGYRLSLVSVETETHAAAGGVLPLRITMRNNGWGKVFKPRPIDLVMRPLGGGAELSVRLTPDARRMLPLGGEQVALDFSVIIPPAAQDTVYNLFLSMPDPAPVLADDPRYHILLANTGIRQADGTHDLQLSVAIGDALPLPQLIVRTPVHEQVFVNVGPMLSVTSPLPGEVFEDEPQVALSVLSPFEGEAFVDQAIQLSVTSPFAGQAFVDESVELSISTPFEGQSFVDDGPPHEGAVLVGTSDYYTGVSSTSVGIRVPGWDELEDGDIGVTIVAISSSSVPPITDMNGWEELAVGMDNHGGRGARAYWRRFDGPMPFETQGAASMRLQVGRITASKTMVFRHPDGPLTVRASDWVGEAMDDSPSFNLPPITVEHDDSLVVGVVAGTSATGATPELVLPEAGEYTGAANGLWGLAAGVVEGPPVGVYSPVWGSWVGGNPWWMTLSIVLELGAPAMTGRMMLLRPIDGEIMLEEYDLASGAVVDTQSTGVPAGDFFMARTVSETFQNVIPFYVLDANGAENDITLAFPRSGGAPSVFTTAAPEAGWIYALNSVFVDPERGDYDWRMTRMQPASPPVPISFDRISSSGDVISSTLEVPFVGQYDGSPHVLSPDGQGVITNFGQYLRFPALIHTAAGARTALVSVWTFTGEVSQVISLASYAGYSVFSMDVDGDSIWTMAMGDPTAGTGRFRRYSIMTSTAALMTWFDVPGMLMGYVRGERGFALILDDPMTMAMSIRAYDLASTGVLWETPLPGPMTAEPGFGQAIGQNDRYLAIDTATPEGRRIVFLDSATGEELGRLNPAGFGPIALLDDDDDD